MISILWILILNIQKDELILTTVVVYVVIRHFHNYIYWIYNHWLYPNFSISLYNRVLFIQKLTRLKFMWSSKTICPRINKRIPVSAVNSSQKHCLDNYRYIYANFIWVPIINSIASFIDIYSVIFVLCLTLRGLHCISWSIETNRPPTDLLGLTSEVLWST